MIKISELRNKTPDELSKELIALFKERFNLRMQKVVGEVTQTHIFKRIKLDIARIKTILREKEGS